MRKAITVGIIIVFCAVLAVSLGCMGNGGQEVNTIKAVKGNLTVKVQSTGTVRSNNEAKLTTVSSGRVSDVFAAENESVVKGKILLKLDSTAQAEKDYNRIASLASKGFMPSQSAEQARDQWLATFNR